MKEIKTTMDLESGKWKINIFEIGNTYQLGAENGDKSVHFMVNKRDYLQDLLDRKKDAQAKEKYNFSCEGKELLSEAEFQTMKKLLLESMDADLAEEKFQWGIIPIKKPDGTQHKSLPKVFSIFGGDFFYVVIPASSFAAGI